MPALSWRSAHDPAQPFARDCEWQSQEWWEPVMVTPRKSYLIGLPSAHPGRDVRMGQLSSWMAENGGTISQAAKSLGWTYDNTKQVWRRILRRMGPQAV